MAVYQKEIMSRYSDMIRSMLRKWSYNGIISEIIEQEEKRGIICNDDRKCEIYKAVIYIENGFVLPNKGASQINIGTVGIAIAGICVGVIAGLFIARAAAN